MRSAGIGEMRRGEEPAEKRLKRLPEGLPSCDGGGACIQECVGQETKHDQEF